MCFDGLMHKKNKPTLPGFYCILQSEHLVVFQPSITREFLKTTWGGGQLAERNVGKMVLPGPPIWGRGIQGVGSYCWGLGPTRGCWLDPAGTGWKFSANIFEVKINPLKKSILWPFWTPFFKNFGPTRHPDEAPLVLYSCAGKMVRSFVHRSLTSPHSAMFCEMRGIAECGRAFPKNLGGGLGWKLLT